MQILNRSAHKDHGVRAERSWFRISTNRLVAARTQGLRRSL